MSSELESPFSGVREEALLSWDAFVQYVQHEMLDYSAYVWRGQRCDDWALEPTIDRKAKELEQPALHSFYKEQLDRFKLAARGRRGNSPQPITDDNEWWALGQHHGLATPLLDWTTSPFVAAFFAFQEVGDDQTEHRAIYALHQPTVEKICADRQFAEMLAKEEKRREAERSGVAPGLLGLATYDLPVLPDIEFVRPQSNENHRLLNQGGLFTRSNTGRPIDTLVSDTHPDGSSSITLLKLLIPDGERELALRMLNRMNINPLSLFPDLSGASQYCNLHMHIDSY